MGIGAGIIGAAFRSFQGGVTVIPCTLGTLFTGVIAAVAWYYFRDRITPVFSVLIAVLVVVLHSTLAIFLSEGGISTGWHIVMETPAAIGYGLFVILPVFAFSWMYNFGKKSGGTV